MLYMLMRGIRLAGVPILSLHTSGAIARVEQAIIDPDSLKIIGFKVSGGAVNAETGNILGTKSIREVARMGLIIDSVDELYDLKDVARVQKIAELNFNLIGLKVETKKGRRLGKVRDFIVNTEDFMILQIVVERPLLKSLTESELLIGRSQIKEVSDSKIVVKDEEAKVQAESGTKDFVPNFVNPFREGRYAMSRSRNPGEQDTEEA